MGAHQVVLERPVVLGKPASPIYGKLRAFWLSIAGLQAIGQEQYTMNNAELTEGDVLPSRSDVGLVAWMQGACNRTLHFFAKLVRPP